MEFPKTSGIYMIRNVENGKCYVGQSENVKRRVEAHERALRHNMHYNQHLQRAWNKYGTECFEFILVEECAESLLDDREIYYIDLYGSYSDGYNLNLGGNSNRGYVHTDETKRKLSERHYDCSGKNNPMYGHSVQEFMTSDEISAWKQNISRAHSGANNPFYGKHHTYESKQKMSKAHKGLFLGDKSPLYGKPRSKELNDKLAKALAPFYERNRGANHVNAKKVVCLNTGCVFDCVEDAARQYGISHSGISQCCTGAIKSAGVDSSSQRLVWAYYDRFVEMSKADISAAVALANISRTGENSASSKAVICITTGEIFGSARVAAKHYGIDNSSICKVCRGKAKTCGIHPTTGERLQWAFYNQNGDDANHTATV